MLSIIKRGFLAYCMRIKSLLFYLLMTLVCLSACSKPPAPLNVQLMWNQQKLHCGASLPEHPQWQLDNIQLYLSKFTNNGESVSFISPYQVKQQDEVILIGGDCQSDGIWQLPFTTQLQPGQVSFELGVPFALNHQNPLKAQPPLNQSDMFWTWQLGHKFLRLDLHKSSEAETQEPTTSSTGWQFHLGSVGCQSASVMRAPSQPCAHPNRAEITLAYQGQQTLILDLAPLLTGVLNKPTLAKQSCMSDPNHQVCQQVLPKVGIGGEQQMWRWQ